jgi:hypothetical protein
MNVEFEHLGRGFEHNEKVLIAIAQRICSLIELPPAFWDGTRYLQDAVNASLDRSVGTAPAHEWIHVEHKIVVKLSDGSSLSFDLSGEGKIVQDPDTHAPARREE